MFTRMVSHRKGSVINKLSQLLFDFTDPRLDFNPQLTKNSPVLLLLDGWALRLTENAVIFRKFDGLLYGQKLADPGLIRIRLNIDGAFNVSIHIKTPLVA